MKKRKMEKDYHELAENRGFDWVGEVLPKNTRTKTWWECRRGHRWAATYGNIYMKTGCPFCSKHIKKTRKDYRNVGNNKHIGWDDNKLPKNTVTKTQWICKICGYQWKAKYNDIQQKGACLSCRKKTEEDYKIVGIDRGISWVGEKLPKNTHIKTKWECKNGHKWEARYHDIKQKHGCPVCFKKTETDYCNLAESCGFNWTGKILSKTTQMKTWWKCRNGHSWKASYTAIYQGNGCPYCKNFINGAPVSKPQIKLNNLLCGSLN